jgi:hypothetical protein
MSAADRALRKRLMADMGDSSNFGGVRARTLDSRMARWRRLAGDLLSEMLHSEGAALRFLPHNSAEVRTAAVEVLKNHWRVRRAGEFSHACERLAVCDAAPGVRHAAVLSLGQCFEFSDDVRVGALLAHVVRDESEADEIRRAAYFALIRVRRSGTRLHPSAAATLKDLRGEIDWVFVDESLNESRTAVPTDRLAVQFGGRMSEERLAEFRLYREGVDALGRGDAEAASRCFSDILKREPNAAGIFAGRARASIALGKLDDAIADLSRAIELRPHSAMLLRERAKAYRLKGAIDLAEQDEQAAAAIDGDANRKEP